MRMRDLIDLYESSDGPDTITMWHGGRNLDRDFNEYHGNKSKQMEHGPGLYLTNWHETASKYAKGGGTTYLVTFRLGTSIREVNLDMDDAMSFLKNTRMPNKKELVSYIKGRYDDIIPARHLMNLMVNFECLASGNSAAVRRYLASKGADYEVIDGAGGWNDQVWAVIFNPAIITSVKAVPSHKVAPDMRKLDASALTGRHLSF